MQAQAGSARGISRLVWFELKLEPSPRASQLVVNTIILCGIIPMAVGGRCIVPVLVVYCGLLANTQYKNI